jgi:hypothetical protein
VKRPLILLVLLLAAAVARAEVVVVPFDVQIPLLLKALTYDRNLKTRAGDQARIAVVVPPKSGRNVTGELQASLDKLPGRTVNGLAVVFKEISATDEVALDDGLKDGQWAAVFVMPGFSRSELAKLRRICETRRVLPVGASIDDVEQGLAFGIGVDGNRPQLVVNLPASKACGSDFDLALLQLSKVLR